jgi:NitT/TauT family transport system permease protein
LLAHQLARITAAEPSMSRPKLIVLQLLVAVGAVLLWQLLTTVPIGGAKLLPPFFFSTPADVAARIAKWFVEGTIWKHLWITLVESVLAFVIGSVAGIMIGFRSSRYGSASASGRRLRLGSRWFSSSCFSTCIRASKK